MKEKVENGEGGVVKVFEESLFSWSKLSNMMVGEIFFVVVGVVFFFTVSVVFNIARKTFVELLEDLVNNLKIFVIFGGKFVELDGKNLDEL